MNDNIDHDNMPKVPSIFDKLLEVCAISSKTSVRGFVDNISSTEQGRLRRLQAYLPEFFWAIADTHLDRRVEMLYSIYLAGHVPYEDIPNADKKVFHGILYNSHLFASMIPALRLFPWLQNVSRHGFLDNSDLDVRSARRIAASNLAQQARRARDTRREIDPIDMSKLVEAIYESLREDVPDMAVKLYECMGFSKDLYSACFSIGGTVDRPQAQLDIAIGLSDIVSSVFCTWCHDEDRFDAFINSAGSESWKDLVSTFRAYFVVGTVKACCLRGERCENYAYLDPFLDMFLSRMRQIILDLVP